MSVTDIPTEQWAQVVEKSGGPVVFKKIPVRKPEADEVLVNIKYSGVCHTDLHAMLGDWPLERKLPLIGGHEGAGVVVAKGELVTSVEIGEQVGVKWLHGSCLSWYTVDGTFQQYAVAKAAHVAHIPKECSLEDVAPILCAGLTVYKGLKESGARPGQYVVIVGAGGGLGCFALQYAKAMGIHTIAVDTGDDKAQVCKELGATAYVDFKTAPDLTEAIKAATPDGLGPHAVLLLATQEKPFQQAVEYVRSRGTIICIGLPGNAYLKAPIFNTVVRMVNIKGSYVGNRQDTAEAIEFFRLGLIKAPHKLVGLSQLQDVYEMMRNNQIVGRYVVDCSK